MGLIDLFHLDHADLADGDAVKGDLDDARNIALVSKESKVVSFRRDLTHHARFAGWHLADNGGEDRVLSVCDAFHFEVRVEQPLGDVTRRLAEMGLRVPETPLRFLLR